MAEWVQWDDETSTMLGMQRHLPPHLEGRTTAHLAMLGYRELVTQFPEDRIVRFPSLLKNAKFEKQPDGRVLRTFPDADFSVAAVRAEIVQLAKVDANRVLAQTDWAVIRSVETGKPVPDAVATLRKKIRDHTDWIDQDVQKAAPRDLVDYRWMFPQTEDQEMINGVAVIRTPMPPPAINSDTHPGPWGQEQATATGLPGPPGTNPQDEPFEAPSTTDGPILRHYVDTGETVYVTAEGVPIEVEGVPTGTPGS